MQKFLQWLKLGHRYNEKCMMSYDMLFFFNDHTINIFLILTCRIVNNALQEKGFFLEN